MKILLAISWVIILLLLFLRFQSQWNIRRDLHETENDPESGVPENDMLGKTKTPFPFRAMSGHAKEANENRMEKGDSFVVGKSSGLSEKENVRGEEDEENEFYPSLPENETDEALEEQEELSLLLEKEIEVSSESITVKELQKLRTAAEKAEPLTETDKVFVKETAVKLRGTEFLEKLRAHELLQRERGRELSGLLGYLSGKSGKEQQKTKKSDAALPKATEEDWMAYL